MSESRQIPDTYRRFQKSYPEVASHYEALGAALAEMGPLDRRSAALAKLALAVGQHSEGGVHSATRKGLESNLEADEMRQVALLAITTAGFPSAMAALTWIEDVVGEKRS